MTTEREPDIGALWKREGRAGEFLTGHITIDGVKHEIVVFANRHKQPGERTPDHRIYRGKPQGERPARNGETFTPRRPADELDDDIPFAWLGALIAPALALLALGGIA